jgi:hypothetical protein
MIFVDLFPDTRADRGIVCEMVWWSVVCWIARGVLAQCIEYLGRNSIKATLSVVNVNGSTKREANELNELVDVKKMRLVKGGFVPGRSF